MKKAMCIVYEVEDSLYINITNRCPNRCSFCIRNNGDGAYGSDSLWLEREPSVEEILKAVFEKDVQKYKEIVFCGYGEPAERLSDAREVALEIKKRYKNVKIRINTNGQSDLILGKNTAPMYKDAFDTVSVSLNASCAEKYQDMCHSVYGKEAFSAIITFAQNVNKYVQNVAFSVVRQALTEKELSECYEISERAGVKLRVREYIPPSEAQPS
jgi:TatD family-associated radical SAM protein